MYFGNVWFYVTFTYDATEHLVNHVFITTVLFSSRYDRILSNTTVIIIVIVSDSIRVVYIVP